MKKARPWFAGMEKKRKTLISIKISFWGYSGAEPALSLVLFPVGGRRLSHDLAEQSGKVIAVINAYFVAHLIDPDIGRVEQFAGILDFQLVEITDGRVPGALGEQSRKVRGAVAAVLCHFLHTHFLSDVLFHEMDGSFYEIFGIGTAVCAPVRLQITQRSHKIMQGRAGIENIVLAVSHLQCVKDFLEKADAAVDP